MKHQKGEKVKITNDDYLRVLKIGDEVTIIAGDGLAGYSIYEAENVNGKRELIGDSHTE